MATFILELATFILGMATFFLGLATFFLELATFFLETRKLENGHILVPHHFGKSSFLKKVSRMSRKFENGKIMVRYQNVAIFRFACF